MKQLEILSSFNTFAKIVYQLITSKVFLLLTLVGNGLIGLSGALFFFLEKSKNPKLVHFIDALWWSFATATTTGYGDITPVTTAGKILGIMLMLAGTAIFAMYTGLFADAILSNERFRRN